MRGGRGWRGGGDARDKTLLRPAATAQTGLLVPISSGAVVLTTTQVGGGCGRGGRDKGAKKSEVPPGPQPTNIGRQTCCQTAHWQPVRAEIGADDFLSSVPRTSSAVICHVRRPLPATAPPITISPNSCAPNRADHVTPLNRSTGCALDRSTGSAHWIGALDKGITGAREDTPLDRTP